MLGVPEAIEFRTGRFVESLATQLLIIFAIRTRVVPFFRGRMLFESDRPAPGSGGGVTLWADDRLMVDGAMANTVPLAFTSTPGWTSAATTAWSWTATTRTGRATRFTGTVKEVVFDLKPVPPEAEQALREHAAVQAVGRGAAG